MFQRWRETGVVRAQILWVARAWPALLLGSLALCNSAAAPLHPIPPSTQLLLLVATLGPLDSLTTTGAGALVHRHHRHRHQSSVVMSSVGASSSATATPRRSMRSTSRSARVDPLAIASVAGVALVLVPVVGVILASTYGTFNLLERIPLPEKLASLLDHIPDELSHVLDHIPDQVFTTLHQAHDQLLALFRWPAPSSVPKSRMGSTLVWPTAFAAWTFIFHPPLPPILALVATLCRIASVLFLIPLVGLILFDVASYAVFRTLGLRRVRVRVRPRSSRLHLSSASSTDTQTRPGDKVGYFSWPGPHAHMNFQPITPTEQWRTNLTPRAPLLTPGTYDAEILLAHHQARQKDDQALKLWDQTGGSFARVSAQASTTSRSSSVSAPSIRLDTGAAGAGGTEDGGQASKMAVQELAEVEADAYEELDPGEMDVGVRGALGFDQFDVDGESDFSVPSTPSGTPRHTAKLQLVPTHPLQLTPLNPDVRRRKPSSSAARTR